MKINLLFVFLYSIPLLAGADPTLMERLNAIRKYAAWL